MRYPIFLLTLWFLPPISTAAAEKKLVCYFASWSHNRRGNGSFATADIDASICTHFIWSFLSLEGNRITASAGDGRNGIRDFADLRSRNPGAKCLVAVGGGRHSKGPEFSNMASSPRSREEFINSTLDLLKQYRLDGLDIDWEYPTFYNGTPSDRENFVLLLKELKDHFKREGYLLSAALASSTRVAGKAYDIPEISKHVDFINLMTYNFYGSWSSQTGHPAGLYSRGSQISVESCVNYWLDKGAPRDQLVVGLTTYGKSWTLSDPASHGIGSSVSGNGRAGPYTRSPGVLAYNELCQQINAGEWTVAFDEQAYAPYAFQGDQWVGYENVQSAQAKANFIRDRGLGGAMVWTIDLDDFRGGCGEKYPILRGINAVLRT